MSRNFTFDNEVNILEYFRDLNDKPLAFPQSENVLLILNSICDNVLWKKWKNTSSKSDSPPDFYNMELKLMLEVMRFDDSANRNGKINKTRSKENQILNELNNKNVLKNFPNLQNVFINADSGLSTEDDHSFERYRDNFKRVISKHAEKAKQYRKNHEGFKLIFFVFDESSGIYININESRKNKKMQLGDNVNGTPHLYFIDALMSDVIKDCKADYLIWFKPYNSFDISHGKIDVFPKIMIYDIKNMKVKPEFYNSDFMISSEV